MIVEGTLGDVQVVVGTVHLESLDQPNVRKAQLELIFEYLESYENVFLMGMLSFML